jgi:magnesium chelatase subunit I
MNIHAVRSLGQLKEAGYRPRSVKEEMRGNLIKAIQEGKNVFEGILGFDDTVIPELERAILSRHNVLLLGLRGQAKTRIARMMINLLDEYMPIVDGSELNDDPFNPLSRYARDLIAEKGDDTPIDWVHRSERYVEKLATPDVSVADLIGDIDPIKAANLKLAYGDERVIHFGLIPRAHRSIFVINELPDLQARIQVALFNILQEGDIQIRGFKLRLPLDIEFVFTANPEDYTNRGSIITPLKDRIDSQILTHYPDHLGIARDITAQEAKLTQAQKNNIYIPEAARLLLEEMAFVARDHEMIDTQSGVSARMSISGLENLASGAERRMLKNRESKTSIRVSDFWSVIPAVTGKVELVYEGEQAGPLAVALSLFEDAIKGQFEDNFPDPDMSPDKDPYGTIKAWFSGKNVLRIPVDAENDIYESSLKNVAGLEKLVRMEVDPAEEDLLFYMELALHGLAANEVISRELIRADMTFLDPLAGMLDDME